MLWVDISIELADTISNRIGKTGFNNLINDLNGKKVHVKGYFNKGRHGHLNKYKASVEYICFIEIF